MTRAALLMAVILWPAASWRLWERLTDEHGRPLEIELR